MRKSIILGGILAAAAAVALVSHAPAQVVCGGGACGGDLIDSSRLPKIECEFVGTNPNPPLGSVGIASGTATNATAGTANHPGLITIRAHTANANSGGAWGVGATAFLISGSEVMESVFRIDRLTDVTAFIGFQDTFAATAPVDGVYFRIPSTGAVVGEATSNSVVTPTATLGTITAGTWYRVALEVNPTATSVSFYLYAENGSPIGSGTVSSGLPTAAGRETGLGSVVTLATATGVAVDLLTMDYLGAMFRRPLVR